MSIRSPVPTMILFARKQTYRPAQLTRLLERERALLNTGHTTLQLFRSNTTRIGDIASNVTGQCC